MDNKAIIVNHTKYRCMWLWVLFIWATYNLNTHDFDDRISSVPLIMNCVNFVTYLLCDMGSMIYQKQLYRTDLAIHHVGSTYVMLLTMQYIPLIGNLILMSESLSLMNYQLRNFPILLQNYRLGCVVIVRIPLWVLTIIYATQYSKNIEILQNCVALNTYRYGPVFFLLYDFYILRQIWKNWRKNQ